MTRHLVYSGAFVAFLAGCALTLASIIVPRWISWDSVSPRGQRVHYTYGLHQRCSSITHTCHYFPKYSDCHGDQVFCNLWRSVGFLMSFAIVVEGMTLLTYLVILAGGKQKREQGWKILSGLHFLVGALQAAGMAVIAHIYNHDDDRFFPGWKLDISFLLCTVSWTVMILLCAGIIATALLLPTEGGYELIPNEEHNHDEYNYDEYRGEE